MSTATTIKDCHLFRIEKPRMLRIIREKQKISELLVTHLLSRNIRCEADLVDQLFNSSERRLARILLIPTNFGKESRTEPVLLTISEQSLTQMVGTICSRVRHFMNKLRKLGFIDYSDNDGLTVHSGLQTSLDPSAISMSGKSRPFWTALEPRLAPQNRYSRQ
jgi:CRP/FNR family cyclic AMP-dependent transcriptional regulator